MIVELALIASLLQPPVCGSTEQLQQTLNKSYEEKALHTGVTNNGNVMQLYVCLKTGSWTVVIHMRNGTSCMIAAGQQLSDMSEQEVKK